MFKTIKTLIAAAALSGTVGANVQAEEITVHKEDTLWGLSQVHNASVENIKEWNHLASNMIHPGDILKIATKKHYIVKKEDTLFSIANENHVSVQSLIGWNDLYTNIIHPGLNLVIYDDSITPGKIVPVNQVELDPKENQTKPKQTSKGPEPVELSSEGSVVVNPVIQHVDVSQPEVSTSIAAPAPVVTPAPPLEQMQSPVPAPVQTTAEVKTPTVPAPTPAVAQDDTAKEITVKATAYTASCEGCSGITKTGVNLKANPDEKVIAVDPSVIPLGSRVYVEGYGEATAADTGGAIKGNRIDVYMKNHSDAIEFGAKELTVKILN
jgi:3D (Asp-Asp-Asp) domain-containing protein/LysM repeat protein